jgi:hypothetical protein
LSVLLMKETLLWSEGQQLAVLLMNETLLWSEGSGCYPTCYFSDLISLNDQDKGMLFNLDDATRLDQSLLSNGIRRCLNKLAKTEPRFSQPCVYTGAMLEYRGRCSIA